MRPVRTVAALLCVIATVAACASGTARSTTAARGDRNMVTSEELRQASASNVFDFLQTARPLWLRKRGQSSIMNEGDIVVYLDDSRLGGPESLRTVATMGIEWMRFLDASAAQQRFGVGHSHGAILLYSRR